MNYTIAIIPGDGIGPEIMEETIQLLQTVGNVFGHNFRCMEVLAGTRALEGGKEPFPAEGLSLCREADSILMGKLAVGRYPHLKFPQRPESVLAKLRAGLELVSDVRPCFLWESLQDCCPLKKHIQSRGMDILVVRDIAGGMFAAKGRSVQMVDQRAAWDTESYNEQQIQDSARLAFDLARSRSRKVTSLDKAILLSSSALWRQVVKEIHKEYLDVELNHMLVDHGAFQLITQPDQFDVILASNVFGDIISDEIAGLTGAGELLPAGSLNRERKGLYTPNQLHQVMEQDVGTGRADPIGLILAAGMMLEYSLNRKQEADAVKQAVMEVLDEGKATQDFWTEGKELLTTKQMGQAIREKIASNHKDI
ncbi:MAG: isocitrate/isopropylmalate family dehydrogenase [Lachnospiraceae bacterium]|nr:isocitrate/isopropylmalate family dehydrogenase [Lachnospiraceae bacterium]